MEPLQNESPEVEPTGTPDTAPDPGLAEATAALESVIGGGKPSAPEKAAATAATAPAITTPPPPKAPSRWDQHRQYQTQAQQSYRQRQAQERARVREMQEERRLLTEQTRQANAVMQQMLDHLRSQQKPTEEEAPDALDPRFPAWLQAQQEKLLTGALDQRLKPALDFIQQQQQEQAQQQQLQQQQARQDAVAAQITSSFVEAEAAYLRESPEIAHGCHERFETVRGVIARSFARAGETPEDAQAMADMWFAAIGMQAEARGWNKMAAIDGLVTAMAEEFANLEPVAPGDDLQGVWNPPPAPPPPARSETSRLAAVQQRARPAAPAAPRVQSRVDQPKSELQELVRGGVQDMKRLRSAALRDAHASGSTNPMKDAAIALGQLAAI